MLGRSGVPGASHSYWSSANGADTAGDRSETARGGSLKLAAAHAAAPVSQPSRSYNGGSPVGEGWLSLVVLGGWVADG
jgi:hypothetical protein